MAKHSHSRSSAASPRRPHAVPARAQSSMPGGKPAIQRPMKLPPNTSSRPDGYWGGPARPPLIADPMSMVGRFGRYMQRTVAFPW
jgi:hypothetical protein